MTYQLYHGDCLEILPTLEAGSVDLIATDLPYGTTACSWDTIIPFAPMWAEVKRVLKPNGVFLTTASQPFTSALVMSNPEWFKYEAIWSKGHTGMFAVSKYRLLSVHENIVVFSHGSHTYNPQMEVGNPYKEKPRKNERKNNHKLGTKSILVINEGTRYPTTIIDINSQSSECNNTTRTHPTQKPVSLYEYLIRTYSNPGETVLDFTCGSGTSGVAALLEGRRFIGIELMSEYYEISKMRLEDTARLLRKEYKPLKDNGASLADLPMFA